jgi:hypothetical protein
MKWNLALAHIFLCLMVLVLKVHTGYAQEIELPYLKCEISLSKSIITAGEPVSILFKFTNTSDGEIFLLLKDSWNIWAESLEEGNKDENINVVLTDENGTDVPRRNLLCRPSSQDTVICEFGIKPGKSLIGDLPIHLRTSTLLEHGEYQVKVKVIDCSFAYDPPFNKGNTIGILSTVKNALETTLSLSVAPYCEPKLKQVYEALMKEVQYALAHPSGSWRGDDYADIAPPVRTILWAEGPMAVPYQIELIYDAKSGFRFWPPAIVNTWNNIVRHATTEQIERVLKMARHPDCKKSPQFEYNYSEHYTPGLVWAIHYWHENGSEEIRELTRDLAAVLPKEEPCPDCMKYGYDPYGK